METELFSLPIDSNRNYLPRDGEVYHYGQIYEKDSADAWFEYLLQFIRWEQDRVFLFGKERITKRKVAWYANQPFEYRYSKVTKRALPWPQKLLSLKARVESLTGESYNSCLLNLYPSGAEGMGWHRDQEKELKKNGAIASLSFGAERIFQFKHKETAEKVSLLLKHGSLLVMKGSTQTHWLHRLPPSKKIQSPRVNLTFRTVEAPPPTA